MLLPWAIAWLGKPPPASIENQQNSDFSQFMSGFNPKVFLNSYKDIPDFSDIPYPKVPRHPGLITQLSLISSKIYIHHVCSMNIVHTANAANAWCHSWSSYNSHVLNMTISITGMFFLQLITIVSYLALFSEMRGD